MGQGKRERLATFLAMRHHARAMQDKGAPPMPAPERPLSLGRVFRQVPFLAALVIVYLIIAFIDMTSFASVLFNITLPSGGVWTFTIGDLILLFGLLMLFAEIVKATRTSHVSIADHALSMITFVVCLLCFLLLPQAATSVFFLLMWMTAVDVIAGFTVSLTGARRDFGMGTDQ